MVHLINCEYVNGEYQYLIYFNPNKHYQNTLLISYLNVETNKLIY